MTGILLIVNFAISCFNAWSCGNVWDSSKAKGGLAYFMAWMGAIMSACGFSWCYLVVLGGLGAILPMSLISEGAEGMMLTPEQLQGVFDLGYLAIILPILGSGLAITVNGWREFARKKHRTAGDYVINGWNTYAQVSNTWNAMRELPGVLERLGGLFGGRRSSSRSSSNDNNGGGLIVIILVVAALSGGILTTYSIIQSRRRAILSEAVRREVMEGDGNPFQRSS